MTATFPEQDLADPTPVPPEVPVFSKDPVLDAVAHVTFELAAELWSVKTRMHLLEQVIEKDGRTVAEVLEEEYAANPRSIRRDEERDAFVRRVFGEFVRMADRGSVV